MAVVIISIIMCACAGVNLERRFSGMRRAYSQARPSISLGDDKKLVIEKLESIQQPFSKHIAGKPMTSLSLKHGTTVDIYFMRTAWFSDGITTDDEYTPYVFVDNILASIGWETLGGPKSEHNSKLVKENASMEFMVWMQKANMWRNISYELKDLARRLRHD